KSCPCAVYRIKWSKLAIIRWPLWSSVRIVASMPLTFCGIAAVVGRPERGESLRVHASLLEECAPPGDIATVHTIIPIHATHVPVNFTG
ncbi:hypothetical protein L9F63_014486, partial [Diploptera punctata]